MPLPTDPGGASPQRQRPVPAAHTGQLFPAARATRAGRRPEAAASAAADEPHLVRRQPPAALVGGVSMQLFPSRKIIVNKYFRSFIPWCSICIAIYKIAKNFIGVIYSFGEEGQPCHDQCYRSSQASNGKFQGGHHSAILSHGNTRSGDGCC